MLVRFYLYNALVLMYTVNNIILVSGTVNPRFVFAYVMLSALGFISRSRTPYLDLIGK